MKKKISIASGTLLLILSNGGMHLNAQSFEWKLDNAVYTPVDPDGAGPATASVTFELQVRSLAGTINNVTGFSLGWAWQSVSAMIPTNGGVGTGINPPGCQSPLNTPSNVVLSPAFAGWQYNVTNECFLNTQTTGGQTFDRVSIGTLENGTINLTTNYITVGTITMWARTTNNPEAGYVVINSSNGVTPGPFPNYEISDNAATVHGATSQTYSTALRLGSILTPVVNPNLLTGIQVSLFPIPVKGTLNVKITSVKSLRTDFQVMDINGKLLQSVNTLINVGTTSFSLDLGSLAPGQYILSSSNPKAPIREKFVILR